MLMLLQVLKGMGDEFLTGYRGLVDGEKDPRNLIIAFTIDRVILTEFDISQHIEVRVIVLCACAALTVSQAFFEITFCYFPITFKPPPNDPYGITSENLQAALRCMLLYMNCIALV